MIHEKVREWHNRIDVLDHPEVWDWFITPMAVQTSVVRLVVRRGEALQRPARNVHNHPYMRDVRRLVIQADLFYIINTNNVCCVPVINLLHVFFRMKLYASAVTLTCMRYCACMCLHGSKNSCTVCRKFTFLVMNWYLCHLQVLSSVVAMSLTFPPTGKSNISVQSFWANKYSLAKVYF